MTKISEIFAMNNNHKGVSDKAKLHLAIKNRDILIISKLIEQNPSLVTKNCDKVLAFLFENHNSENVTQQQITKILKIFIDRGMDINIANDKRSLLHSAVEHKMQIVVEFLMQRGIKTDFDDFPITYFFIERLITKSESLVSSPHLLKIEDIESAKFIEWLVKKDFNFNLSVNNTGLSLFHLVIQNKLHNVAKILLKYTGTENEMIHIYLETYKDLLDRRFQGFYNYKYLKKQYSLDILKSILDMGFSVDAKNSKKETALHIAAKLCLESEILDLLFEKFSAARATDKNRKTVLHLLVENYKNLHWKTDDYERFLSILFEKGSDISIRDSQGFTALQRAVKNENIKALSVMKEYKVKFNVKTRDGKNLLHLVNENNESMIEFLIEAGVDINGIDKNGRSPLHNAVLKNSKVYELLLRYGAYVDVIDNKELKALNSAMAKNNEEMIKNLLKYGSDIHDMNVSNAFNSMKDNSEDNYFFKYLVSLGVAGLLYNSRLNFLNVESSFIYEDCQREIEGMKQFFIGEKTTLLDFMKIKSIDRKCFYVNNEKLKELVENDHNIEKKFPNYATVIQGNYRQAVARKSMLNSAELIWYDLTKIDLPNVCVRRVLRFLNTIELSIFVEKRDRLFIERRLSTLANNFGCLLYVYRNEFLDLD